MKWKTGKQTYGVSLLSIKDVDNIQQKHRLQDSNGQQQKINYNNLMLSTIACPSYLHLHTQQMCIQKDFEHLDN